MIGVAYECFLKQMVMLQAAAEQREQTAHVSRELLGWYNAEKIYNCEQPELLACVAPARTPLYRRFAGWVRGVMAGIRKTKAPVQNVRGGSVWHGAEASGAVRVQR